MCNTIISLSLSVFVVSFSIIIFLLLLSSILRACMHRYSYFPGDVPQMRRRQKPAIYPLSSLHRFECGYPLPPPLLWHLCKTSLACLRPSRSPFHPVSFPSIRPLYNRYPHISQLLPSPDHALLAIASNDSNIQLHEPVTDNSHSLRLTLFPLDQNLRDNPASWLRFAGSCWVARKGNESLVLGFENRDFVWLYDLQTCSVTRPTIRFALESPNECHSVRKGARDVKAVDENIFLVSMGMAFMRVFDVRAGNRPIGTISTGMNDVLLSGQGIHVYAGGCGYIAMYDRRMAESVKTSNGGGTRSFGGKSELKKSAEIARKAHGGRGGLAYLGTPPGSAPGCVAYQAADGGVGLIDMTDEGQNVHIGENEAEDKILNMKRELRGLGESDVLGKRAWYLKRRQCDIVHTPGGRGWLIISPNVQREGVRAVNFEPGLHGHSFDIVDRKDYSCVHTIAQSMERFVLGGPKNTVEVFDVEVAQSMQPANEPT